VYLSFTYAGRLHSGQLWA